MLNARSYRIARDEGLGEDQQRNSLLSRFLYDLHDFGRRRAFVHVGWRGMHSCCSEPGSRQVHNGHEIESSDVCNYLSDLRINCASRNVFV